MRDWQQQVDDFSNVMKLIHLAMRKDKQDAEKVRAELVKARRRAYEDELTIQAGRVGCAGQQGRLTKGPALNQLNEMSKTDAESIVNTYNYDLAMAIEAIKAETPSANRSLYVKRLTDWEESRNFWKIPQIAMYTENTARSQAQADFYRMNKLDGVATLEPKTAKEEICAGWIRRGEVPLKEALKNPGPFHPFCPHLWVINSERVPRQECPNLWMGE